MIKRYFVSSDDFETHESEQGEWVKFKDVEKIVAELSAHPLLKLDTETGEVAEIGLPVIITDGWIELQIRQFGKEDPYIKAYVIPHMSNEQLKKYGLTFVNEDGDNCSMVNIEVSK